MLGFATVGASVLKATSVGWMGEVVFSPIPMPLYLIRDNMNTCDQFTPIK